jgi:integrase
MNTLTVKQLDAIKKAGNYHVGGGLYLKVQTTGTKSWLFRYGTGGRRSIGLGRYSDIKFKEAKEKALEQRRLLIEGVDPKLERDARQRASECKVVSFKEAAEQFIADRSPVWKSKKHGDQWKNTLSTYVFPKIGHLSCDEITIEHMESILSPIWTKKHETATRVRGRVENIIDWAKVKFKLSTSNPAALKGNLEHILPKVRKATLVKHHSALPYQKITDFIKIIVNHDVMSAKALLFCILTATRTSEVLGARWEEIDFEARTWTIPRTRMKKGKEHRVPLSDTAINILGSISENQNSGLIFYSERKSVPLSNMAMLAYLKGKKGYKSYTVHGFRSTFRDWAGETTDHRREVIEHALAHKLADQAEAAYQRGDLFQKRRALMEDWNRFLMSSV